MWYVMRLWLNTLCISCLIFYAKKQPLLPSIPSHSPTNQFLNVLFARPKHMNIIEFPWMRIWVRGKLGGERTHWRAVTSDSRHFWNKMVKLWNAKWIISCLQNHTDILKTALWVLWDICAWVNLMLFFEWYDLRLVQWKVSCREGNKGHLRGSLTCWTFWTCLLYTPNIDNWSMKDMR